MSNKQVIVLETPISERYCKVGDEATLDIKNQQIRCSGAWFKFDNRWKIKKTGPHMLCSACGEPIPDHEKDLSMLNVDVNDLECMACEMLFRDSADLDNDFGAS